MKGPLLLLSVVFSAALWLVLPAAFSAAPIQANLKEINLAKPRSLAERAASGRSAKPKTQIRKAQSQRNINQKLKNRLSSLPRVCDKDQKGAKQQLSFFADQLDEWKRWIIAEKTAGRLNLDDRLLLNEMLSQIQELPYRELIEEIPRPSEAAAAIKSYFEGNYRYNYNLPAPEPIAPAWAQGILEALSCPA